MVSQATQNFIFTVVDANFEYNTKITVLCLILLYLVFSIWFANRIIPFRFTRDQREDFPIYQQFSVILMRVVPIILLIFYPLIISIVMYREYDIDALITLMLTAYGMMTLVGIGVWFLFGMSWVQDLIALAGIETRNKRGTIIRRKDK